MTFKVKDAAEKAAEIFGALEDIPGLGELLDLVDKAIEAAIKPAIDAIADTLPSINVPEIGNPLAEVPFEKVWKDLEAIVKEQIERVKTFMQDVERAVSKIPNDCPEFTNAVIPLALRSYGLTAQDLGMQGRSLTSSGLSMLTNVILKKKKQCEVAPSNIMRETVEKTSIQRIGEMMNSAERDDDGKPMTSKQKKKQDRKKSNMPE